MQCVAKQQALIDELLGGVQRCPRTAIILWVLYWDGDYAGVPTAVICFYQRRRNVITHYNSLFVHSLRLSMSHSSSSCHVNMYITIHSLRLAGITLPYLCYSPRLLLLMLRWSHPHTTRDFDDVFYPSCCRTTTFQLPLFGRTSVVTLLDAIIQPSNMSCQLHFRLVRLRNSEL